MNAPRFLADEDLRREIVFAVRRLNPEIEIATAQELGLSGKIDDIIIEFSQDEGWLLVSHDVNTMKGLAEHRIREGEGISGLFLVPQFQLTRAVAESLLLIAEASQAEEWENRIVYLPL